MINGAKITSNSGEMRMEERRFVKEFCFRGVSFFQLLLNSETLRLVQAINLKEEQVEQHEFFTKFRNNGR